jgi:flagellar biosynthesis/type III secretory pathway M-ring protein FliF/YscJ
MFAMRPALYTRESCTPAEQPPCSTAPTNIAAQTAIRDAEASPDLAARIAQARRDARRDPAQAAMLLRSWMSDHG